VINTLGQLAPADIDAITQFAVLVECSLISFVRSAHIQALATKFAVPSGNPPNRNSEYTSKEKEVLSSHQILTTDTDYGVCRWPWQRFALGKADLPLCMKADTGMFQLTTH
jgi:hypothetical protein